MKEIIIDGIVYVPKEEEFTYPMWFKSIALRQIIKFSGLEEGIIIVKGKSLFPVGYESTEWIPHTVTDIWVQVEDPNKIQDKDLVYCWDKHGHVTASIRFYDAVNERVYSPNGKRNGASWNNYSKVDIDTLPEALKDSLTEARKTLEDK